MRILNAQSQGVIIIRIDNGDLKIEPGQLSEMVSINNINYVIKAGNTKEIGIIIIYDSPDEQVEIIRTQPSFIPYLYSSKEESRAKFKEHSTNDAKSLETENKIKELKMKNKYISIYIIIKDIIKTIDIIYNSYKLIAKIIKVDELIIVIIVTIMVLVFYSINTKVKARKERK